MDVPGRVDLPSCFRILDRHMNQPGVAMMQAPFSAKKASRSYQGIQRFPQVLEGMVEQHYVENLIMDFAEVLLQDTNMV